VLSDFGFDAEMLDDFDEHVGAPVVGTDEEGVLGETRAGGFQV
jgi:hypothetical protein